ncbi:MAG: DUF2815 family protein [Betaproteobacteria bacterium]|nr:DUF2815 family protein [Betaproteobacteria bacterium]
MSNNNPAHIVTGTCRASFCHLIQPKRNANSGEPRYSVTLLLPKSDVATKQMIDYAIEAAAQNGMARLWNGQRPPMLPTPIYDGDGVRPSDGAPFSDECKGHWVFTASGKQQPSIVDTNLQPILQPTEVYSGMYIRAGVTFFPYFQQGKRGIGCALDNVQKLADGEPLGGNRASAQDDFGQAAPAANYGAAAPQARPPIVNQPPLAAPGYQPPAYQPPAPTQPGYPPAYQPPAAPQGYPQPAQTQPYDPITGLPAGGVHGI